MLPRPGTAKSLQATSSLADFVQAREQHVALLAHLLVRGVFHRFGSPLQGLPPDVDVVLMDLDVGPHVKLDLVVGPLVVPDVLCIG